MINKKTYTIFFWLIIFFSLTIRLLPVIGNNFYFTMDQGLDAVDVREIWARGQIFLTGSPTAFAGLFTGPLWYYFAGLGYFIFKGHPFGPLFLQMILNTLITAYLMWKLKPISLVISLISGISLQFFWPFYDTSRYSFNPFLLVALAYVMIILLTEALGKKKNAFVLASIPVSLAFHSEVATFVVFLVFYVAVGIWLFWKQLISKKNILSTILIIFIFFIPTIIFELTSGFSQTQTLLRQLSNKSGVMAATNFNFLLNKALEIVGETTLPQAKIIGAVIFFLLIGFCLYRKKINPFIKRFTILSLILALLSFIWFASNKGWQTWHTVYISPLLFTSLILLLLDLRSALGYLLFSLILLFQILFFQKTYLYYFKPSSDPSLLINEIAAIDWIYQKSEGRGFYVYNYLPSVLDYPYQYLFWWYGLKKYGYLPCEFSSYPKAPKLFIRGREFYEDPKKTCTDLRFLIIEPAKNTVLRENWINELRQNYVTSEKTTSGRIEVEMLDPLK